jgi:NAD(P)-dependent dehydrogenase (short-subunit alcohol dehydrogenase family)
VDGEVLVVIGAGGMGQAIARRQSQGKAVLLADLNETAVKSAGASLEGDGRRVTTQHVDVSLRASVVELAETATRLGRVTQVVHTAGLSPAQAPVSAILAVDLLGVALVLEEFGHVIAAGAAGVVIASMAGHLGVPLTAEQEEALARVPTDELLGLPFLGPEAVTAPAHAYGLAKRANQLRVEAAGALWGQRGARINSLSPGVVDTPMGQQELASDLGRYMRTMVDASAAGRLGTPEDIAAAAAFLLGPDSAFITGTDLLVDGGVVAASRWGGQ